MASKPGAPTGRTPSASPANDRRRSFPTATRLNTASTALTDRIEAAGRELSAAQARRAEIDARATPPQATARMAA